MYLWFHLCLLDANWGLQKKIRKKQYCLKQFLKFEPYTNSMWWGQHIYWNVKMQRPKSNQCTTVIYISVNNGGLLIFFFLSSLKIWLSHKAISNHHTISSAFSHFWSHSWSLNATLKRPEIEYVQTFGIVMDTEHHIPHNNWALPEAAASTFLNSIV